MAVHSSVLRGEGQGQKSVGTDPAFSVPLGPESSPSGQTSLAKEARRQHGSPPPPRGKTLEDEHQFSVPKRQSLSPRNLLIQPQKVADTPLSSPRQSGASFQKVEGNEQELSISIVSHPVVLVIVRACPSATRCQTPEASSWP